MQLIFLLLLLTAPYLILSLADRITGFKTAPTTRARIGLTLFFLFTGAGHFIRAEEMSQMVPPPLVPFRLELIYITGVLELLGAAGVWIPRLTRLTGFCLIIMLIGLLPANIYSALNRVDFGGHGAGLVYLLVRVPFQLFVIGWTYFSTEQDWLHRGLK